VENGKKVEVEVDIITSEDTDRRPKNGFFCFYVNPLFIEEHVSNINKDKDGNPINREITSYHYEVRLIIEVDGEEKDPIVEPLNVDIFFVNFTFGSAADEILGLFNLDKHIKFSIPQTGIPLLGGLELELLMEDGFVDEMVFIETFYNRYSKLEEQTRAQYVDLKVVLDGDMTRKTENAGRMADFYTRAPMLDTDIIDLAYRLPTAFKISKKNRKIILKDTFADIIPRDLLSAPKRGFAVPISKWLSEELNEHLEKFISKDFITAQGLFNYQYIRETVQKHVAKKEDRASELWAFYVFQNWYSMNIGC
jgi:hypothetical protein